MPWAMPRWPGWRPPRQPAAPLLPVASRRRAAGLAAGCVAVTAVLAVLYRHHDRPGWLDAAVDPRVQAGFGGHPALLNPLVRLGDPPAGIAMTLALVLGCVAVRRWRGALLAGIAVPAASALTELVLKPVVGRTLHGALSFPSGHATSMFALAAGCAVLLARPPRARLPASVRASLAIAAVLVAAMVALAMVALDYHYLTDAVAGAATGTGVVLLTALALDRYRPAARRDRPAAGRSLPEAARPAQPGAH